MKLDKSAYNYDRNINDIEFQRITNKYIELFYSELIDGLSNLDISQQQFLLKKLIKYNALKYDLIDLYINNKYYNINEPIDNSVYKDEEKEIYRKTYNIQLKILEKLGSKGKFILQLLRIYDQHHGFLRSHVVSEDYYNKVMDPQGFTFYEFKKILVTFSGILDSEYNKVLTNQEPEELNSPKNKQKEKSIVKANKKSPVIFAYYYALRIHFGDLAAGKENILKYETAEGLKHRTLYNYFYTSATHFAKVEKFKAHITLVLSNTIDGSKRKYNNLLAAFALIERRNDIYTIPQELKKYIDI